MKTKKLDKATAVRQDTSDTDRETEVGLQLAPARSDQEAEERRLGSEQRARSGPQEGRARACANHLQPFRCLLGIDFRYWDLYCKNWLVP